MSVETHFENIQEEIVSKLKKAEKQILVAVAWLTDQRLFEILCNQADNFIDVQVLIVNDEINLQSGIDYQLKFRTSCNAQLACVSRCFMN